MRKKPAARLVLSRETLRFLSSRDLGNALGRDTGSICLQDTCVGSCLDTCHKTCGSVYNTGACP